MHYALIVLIAIIIVQFIFELILGRKRKGDTIGAIFHYMSSGKPLNTNQMIRANVYERTKSVDFLYELVKIELIVIPFSLVFFRNISITILIAMAAFSYPYASIKSRAKLRKRKLNYQFKDSLISISNSLKSGQSIRNALIRAHNDLEVIYKKNDPILVEFDIIAKQLMMDMPIRDVLIDFKKRADIEDIEDFVNIALLTKEMGGNLNEVIENVSKSISEKIQIEVDINTMLAAKKMEVRILSILPIAIVLVLTFFSPDYMEPMYSTVIGRVLMILGIVLLVVNYYVGKKIIDIDI